MSYLIPEAYLLWPSNFVSQRIEGNLVVQTYRADMADPWRIKIIGTAIGQFVIAAVVAILLTPKARAYAMAWGAFLLFRLWLELSTGDPSGLFYLEALTLALCMVSAYLWNRWGPRLKVVWNRWR